MRKRYIDPRHPTLSLGREIQFHPVHQVMPDGYDGPPVVWGVYETSSPQEQRLIEESASAALLTIVVLEADPPPAPEPLTRGRLGVMNKAALLEVCASLELTPEDGSTNAELVELIAATFEEHPTPEG